MKILVPSLGRCGSTLVTDAIGAVMPGPSGFANDLTHSPNTTVVKTHAHFRGEPGYAYRAVFVWGYIPDIVASLAARTTNAPHFHHLEVAPDHIARYLQIEADDSRMAALCYMVERDRLRFKTNLASWRCARHVMFVQYEALRADPAGVFGAISAFVGTQVPAPEIMPRQSDRRTLPGAMRDLLYQTYPRWLLGDDDAL